MSTVLSWVIPIGAYLAIGFVTAAVAHRILRDDAAAAEAVAVFSVGFWPFVWVFGAFVAGARLAKWVALGDWRGDK